MATAVGAPDPGEFERNQPHNIFNDRRVGGRAKNRAFAKNYVVKPPVAAAAPPGSPPRGPKKIKTKGYPSLEHP